MDARTSRFIEQFGLLFERDGHPRIAGRLTGYLLVAEGSHSLDEIAEELDVSKASVSTDARRMESHGLLERISRPGDRRDYYRIAPDAFRTMLRTRLESLERFSALCLEARRLPIRSSEVRERVDEWTGFVDAMIRSMTDVLADWERHHAAQTADIP
jgi:DNA-binding transcriptional regulator GbsR (MarR family)